MILKVRAWFVDGVNATMPGQIMSTQGDRTLGEFFRNVEDAERDHGYKAIFLLWTGLKDKNGVEIFEGDILVITGRIPILVGFEGGCFCDVRTTPFKTLVRLFSQWDEHGEVIGSIHTHPELLEAL